MSERDEPWHTDFLPRKTASIRKSYRHNYLCSLYRFFILVRMVCHVSSWQALRYTMQQAEKHITQREREDEEYIVHLVGKVVTVSVETVRLVNELAQAVKMEDWMNGDDRTELIERVIDE